MQKLPLRQKIKTSCNPLQIPMKFNLASIVVKPEDVQLTPHHFYDLRRRFAKIISLMDKECVNKSMAIFISNIPCDEMDNYPDIRDMFKDDLNGFVQEMFRTYYLHME